MVAKTKGKSGVNGQIRRVSTSTMRTAYRDSVRYGLGVCEGRFASFLGLVRENKTAVVLLSNSQKSVDEVADKLLRLMHQEPTAKAEWVVRFVGRSTNRRHFPMNSTVF